MTSATELAAWLNGVPNGGPQGNGRYPMTHKDGQVHMILAPLALPLDPNAYYPPAVLSYLLTEEGFRVMTEEGFFVLIEESL